MRPHAISFGGATLLWASTVAAQVSQPPPGTMSPSEIPPGFTIPPPPSPPAPPPPKYRHKSTGMMIAGIVLVSIGGTAHLGGFVYTALTNQRCQPGTRDLGVGQSLCMAGSIFVGTSIMLGGAVLAGAIGAPLLTIGARRLPEPERSSSAAPSLLVGPGSATLRWTF